MKYITMFIFMCCINLYNAQNITVRNLDENKKSEVMLSDNTVIDVFFDYNTFDINSSEFKFKDRKILKQTKIGDYGIDELRLTDNTRLKYKFKRRENKVYALDKSKQIAFEGNLIFNNKNKSILDKIEIVKNYENNNLVESWITLATLNKLYGSQSKELFRMLLGGAVFGATVGVVHGVSK